MYEGIHARLRYIRVVCQVVLAVKQRMRIAVFVKAVNEKVG